MKKRNLIISGVIVLLLIIIILFLVLKNNKKELNENFILQKEGYKINAKDNKINLEIDIKNKTKEKKDLENITIKIINKDNQEVFFYYKNVEEVIKPKDDYHLNINESIKNSNLNSEEDIKEIKYEINK